MKNNWFTIEAADADTVVISEYRHAEETHCYLLMGTRRAVLIDSGLGVADIGGIVTSLTSLPLTVVTTHVHWDHIGGHGFFSEVAVFHCEKDWISGDFPLSPGVVKKNLLAGSCEFPPDFDIDRYEIYQGGAGQLLFDGDEFDLGGRRLVVIHTPGHSPGHICFWEPERGYLFSGDLIYAGILDAFYPSTDPVRFMQSVTRVGKLPVKRIFPGHHKLELSADMIRHVRGAFESLAEKGLLHHGAGVFDFSGFGIHI